MKNRKSKWLFFFIVGSFDMKDVINFKEYKFFNDLWNIKFFCFIYNLIYEFYFMF